MSSNIHFTGTENIDEIFNQLPAQYQRPVMLKIFAKAAGKFISVSKRRFNGSLKRGVGYVQGRSKERPALYAGLVRKGANNWQYQRAYWRNFGTLANRSPEWSFTKGRKSKTAKWRGGLKPTNAIGESWAQTSAEAERIITQDAAKIANDFLKRKAKAK